MDAPIDLTMDDDDDDLKGDSHSDDVVFLYETKNNNHNTNNAHNGRRTVRDWDNNASLLQFHLFQPRRRYNNYDRSNSLHNNSNNNNRPNSFNSNKNRNNNSNNMKYKDSLQNSRHFTKHRTLSVSNVPYAIKANQLMEFLNQAPTCYGAVQRVHLTSYEPNRHSGKGRILFASRQITNDVLHYDVNSHCFIIRGRELKFNRWKRNKRPQDDHNDAKENKYDEEHDAMYNLGAAIIMFGHHSYPYVINQNHTEPFDSVAFDFDKRCIRAQSTFPISYLSNNMATPKAIEYRISFKDIINEITYYEKENMMVLNLYHPFKKYKIFPDTQYEDYDTEKSLCQRIQRSLCDSKFAQNMFVMIKFKEKDMESMETYNCFISLQKYELLKTTSAPFNCRLLSLQESNCNNFTVGKPPEWIYKLPEHIQYLLACLHTKQPAKLSYSSMNNDSKFIEIINQFSDKNINVLLSTALEHMFWVDNDYIDEPAQALRHYIDQKFNPTHSNDMESGFGLIRHAWVSLPGLQLLPPYLETTNRVVRWYPALTDHFMRVTFCECDGARLYGQSLSTETTQYIVNALKKGIFIGKRRYDFLAFGSSQLNEQSVWMYYDDGFHPNISADTIRARMGDFSHIKSVAKYAARMGQCFSTTVDSIKTNDVVKINDVTSDFPAAQYIDDIFTNVGFAKDLIPCKSPTQICFSDGVGRISPAFASKVAHKLGLKVRPSAFQIRYGGYKGMVAVYPECKHDLELRPSMNKFESDDVMFEVCRYSFCSPVYLNRQIITLFETVNPQISTTNILVQIAAKVIAKLTEMRMDRSEAINQLRLRSFGNSPLSPIYGLVQLLQNKMPMRHPFISTAIDIFVRSELKSIQNRHRILIKDGTSILGVMDEYNVLKANQVFIQIRSPLINKNKLTPIIGDVIITKCPALAPGDLRKFEAVATCPQLKHLKNVVVFSQQGILSPTMQMSGSDLDGDIYWITWDKMLLKCFENIYNDKPLYFPTPKQKLVDSVTVDELQQFFVDYMQMDCLGMLAHSHLAVADQSHGDRAKNKKCIILAVLNSYAVDYRKSGTPVDIKQVTNWYGINNRESLLPRQFPYFMRKYNSVYASKYALGQIYRICFRELRDVSNYNNELHKTKCESFDTLLRINGCEKYEREARNVLAQYSYDILAIKNRWCVKTEMEIWLNRPLSNIKLPNLKEFDIKQKIKNSMNQLKSKYRKLFFDQFKNEKEEKKEENDVFMINKFNLEMKRKASAWYLVTMQNIPIETQNKNYNNVILTLPFIVFDILCSILS